MEVMAVMEVMSKPVACRRRGRDCCLHNASSIISAPLNRSLFDVRHARPIVIFTASTTAALAALLLLLLLLLGSRRHYSFFFRYTRRLKPPNKNRPRRDNPIEPTRL